MCDRLPMESSDIERLHCQWLVLFQCDVMADHFGCVCHDRVYVRSSVHTGYTGNGWF